MDRSSVLISAGANDNTHDQTGDGLVELKSNSKVHNPFRLYDNFRKGCTNVLTAPRGLKGSNGFRNNGGHPTNHHSQCYEVADAQSSLASTSIQITSIKSRRLNSEADSSDSSNSADDTTTQVIKVKCSPKHRLSDSSTCSSSNEDTRYPQPIGEFSKEIFSSLDSTLGRDDSLPLCVSSSEQVNKASDSEDHNDRNKTEKRVHINDGSSTDDSGVDSLCCILENDIKISGGSKKLNENESNNQYLTQDHKTVNTLSASSLHDSSTSKSATSFLHDIATYGYDTISKKRNSIWKKEYNVSGAVANGSDNYVTSVDQEDLINEYVDTKDHHTYANIHFKGNSYSLVPDDKRSNVELTSVVQNKSLINILSNEPRKTSKSIKQESEDKVKLNRKGELKSVKNGSAPIYSSVNVAAKKAGKKKSKDSSVCKQISNAAFAKLPVIKFLAEDIDIGETSVANSDTHGNEVLADHSNFNDLPRSTGPKEAEVTDLRELTKLLNNTSALLQRNSNLRASLTISVKNPRNGASNAKTFVLPSGRDGKDTAKNQTGTSPINIKNSDSKNGLRTVATTNQLDANNVTVLVNHGYQNNTPSDDFKYNEMPIDCEFKTSSCIPNQADTTISPDFTKLNSDKDDAEDDQFISLVNIDAEADPLRPPAFVRHNPIRRPVVAAAMTTTNSNTTTVSVATKSVAPTVCRRSIRLAPKTVANLANKFEACDRLLASNHGSSNVSQGKKVVSIDTGNSVLTQKNDKTSKKTNSNIPEKELKLCKKDITKIIGTLNRLEEDAKRSCYRPRPMTTPGSMAKKNSNSNIHGTNNDFCTKSGTQGKIVVLQYSLKSFKNNFL